MKPRAFNFLRSVLAATLVSIVAIAVAAAFAFARPTPATAKGDDDTYDTLAVFAKVLQVVENQYVDPVSPRQLIYAAIRGLLGALDPHSAFFTPDECKGFREGVDGEYGGIGVVIRDDDSGEALVVEEVVADTPADRANVLALDRITAIDGQPVKALGGAALEALRGPAGSSVTVKVETPAKPEKVATSVGPHIRTLTLVRELVRPDSVAARTLAPGYGYVRIKSFQERTAARTQEAVTALRNMAGKGFRGLILDLRGNPGGLLEPSLQVADLFIARGVLLTTRGRDDAPPRIAHEAGTEPGYPLVVLIDAGTASAAEIVAGALQDYRRALLVGVPSFGKGSVQSVLDLPDGSCMKLTVSRYYTPSGRSIQELGIVPDVLVGNGLPTEGGNEVEGILRERDLKGHLRSEAIAREPATPELTGDDAADPQLRSAFNLLVNWDAFRYSAPRK
jgi:carboxyl-terminal processing protease